MFEDVNLHRRPRRRFSISDWGIASIKARQLKAVLEHDTGGDALSTFNNVGTLFYMAPERFLKGWPSSIASDVFSIGMICFELTTGTLPFRDGESAARVLLSGEYLKRIDLETKRHNLSHSLREFIACCVAIDPAMRFSSYAQIELILRRLSSNPLRDFGNLLTGKSIWDS